MPDATAPVSDWVDIAEAAGLLGFDTDTVRRLVCDATFPTLGLAGKGRTAHRIPRALVMEARSKVFSGETVELREFARQWASRNTGQPAVAAVALPLKRRRAATVSTPQRP
jgi:hypothetical protein